MTEQADGYYDDSAEIERLDKQETARWLRSIDVQDLLTHSDLTHDQAQAITHAADLLDPQMEVSE